MILHTKQRTLAKTVSCEGVGVHSGIMVRLTLKPAPFNHGIKFVRTDLPDSPAINALFKMVVDTSLATVIGQDGVIVSTIEHLMASFTGLSIDNAIVELDGYEMPIMDGSARVFTEMILDAGIKILDAPRSFFVITNPLVLQEGDKYVKAKPYDSFRLNCIIDFNHPLIGQQAFDFHFSEETFAKEISGARTFGFYQDIEHLKQFGLAKGATLDTGIAIDKSEIMNKEGLRYKDEFVRHKLLDCIGDFSLIGMPILGHFETFKSGHAFNYAFLEELFARKDCWETRTFDEELSRASDSPKSLAI